ncbi:MAG: MBL fold metallo-hydrolase [Pseudomonadota bacterium]
MRRILVGLGVLAAVALAAAWFVRDRLALDLFQRGVARAMTADVVGGLPDGLHVAVCGAGGPLPDGDRGGPCTAVIAGRRLFIVDAGEGAARTLGRMGIAAPRTAVLLTHFHSDHIDGLGALALQRWAGQSAATPLPLYGPPGVERIAAGFNEAYAQDVGYRVAHHGEAVVPPSGAGLAARPFAFPEGGDRLVILDEDGLKITAFKVDHGPVDPAVGYRFDYAGRSVVISGDTAASAVLAREAAGVDLLVHDALAPNLVAIMREAALAAGQPNRARIFADIPGYHASPAQVADVAARKGVRAVLLTHIVPPIPMRPLAGPFLGEAPKIFRGPLWIARDGDLVSLPAGGEAVTRTSLLR